jgi:hypothetical protein
MDLDYKTRRLRYVCLRHTPLECPRLRYSVSREAPEKLKADNNRRRRPAPQDHRSEEHSLFEGRFNWGVREGYVTAVTTSLKTWLSWLKVNLRAPKDLPSNRWSTRGDRGSFPGGHGQGIWSREYANGIDEREATTSSSLLPSVSTLAYPWCLVTLGAYPRLIVSSRPKGLSSRLYSQRLHSKAMLRFASPALSLTRRPTHWPLIRRSPLPSSPMSVVASLPRLLRRFAPSRLVNMES